MKELKRVVAIHDISGFGKCSMILTCTITTVRTIDVMRDGIWDQTFLPGFNP
ncbi:MAG: hypothetical protein LBB73_02485 [Dysgonamonadaceae bacterium]|nr:hypothetical protein [Dysgonamonadaceae bacterium]